MKSSPLAAVVLGIAIPEIVIGQTLGFDGISPVRVGMTVAQAEQALHARLSLTYPPDSDSTDCAIADIKGRNFPLSYMIENGRVTRVDLVNIGTKSTIKTASGIGIGSTINEIKRAYGTRGKWHPNEYTDEPVFEIKSNDNKSAILFDTEKGHVIHIQAGRLPSAEYIEGCL